MQIALPISDRTLTPLLPHGCLNVPDLPDLVKAFEEENGGKPFSMQYRSPEDILPVSNALRKVLSKHMKHGDRVIIDELTVFVMEDFPGCCNQEIFFSCLDRPRDWAVGFKYRQDVDWWLVIKGGKYLEADFFGQPIILLLQTNDLNQWTNASHFFPEIIWNLIVNHGTLPAAEVFPFMERMLKTTQLSPLFEALKNVNFFQVIEKDKEDLGDFSIQVNTSSQAWTEVEQLTTALYPQFFQAGGAVNAAEIWERFKADKRSVVMLARSNQSFGLEESEVPLGFLTGGIHPTSQMPHLMLVCVLPDERRRLIGTGLVRRFFSHTAYQEVIADLHIKPCEEPYEIAAFFDSLNGVLRKKLVSTWTFRLVNPFLK